MPVFTPWTSTTDPPIVGDRESMVLDFKGLPSKKKGSGDERDPRNWDHAVNAKDIAAFANAIGGVLLLGADDNGGSGAFARFVDIDAALADAIEKHYTDAAKDRVRPTPVVTFVRSRRDDSVLVAVNVQPFPGQAVGAKQSDDSWVFPVRVLDRNVPYSPEQLPMLMIPELRRVATLLQAVPSNKGISIHTTAIRRVMLPVYHLTSISETFNCVTLQCYDRRAVEEGGWSTVMTLPFDDIESVWKTPDERWHLRVRDRSPHFGAAGL